MSIAKTTEGLVSPQLPDAAIEGCARISCSIEGFPDEPARAEAMPPWFGLLEALPEGSTLTTEISPAPIGIAVLASLFLPRRQDADGFALLQLALPGARLVRQTTGLRTGARWTAIRPTPFAIPERPEHALSPQLLAAGQRDVPCLINLPPITHVNWEQLVRIVTGFAVRLRLDLSIVELNASAIRGLERMSETLHAAAFRFPKHQHEIGAVQSYVSEVLSARRAVRVEVCARAANGASVPANLICRAVFGHAAGESPFVSSALDLRGLWPRADWLPHAIPGGRLATAAQRQHVDSISDLSPGALRVGETSSGAPLVLSGRDRDRHVYVIGATGTGKSTLLLNFLAQDARKGEGVILLDPHGDLADEAMEVVERTGRQDVIFADASDPAGAYRINLLDGVGASAGASQNYVVNGLIRLLRRALYDGVPEAFGPMFELYFRNAFFLLMSRGGDAATLMDFDRVFTDDKFRQSLLTACTEEKVVQFWRDIAQRVTHDETSLRNITPYIVSKLAQFTSNPTLRELLCAKSGALDFSTIMDEGRILILRAPKGLLGQTDTEILAAVTLMRIAQVGMSRAARPKTDRRPVRLYVDEFQTCAGDGLADILAEARKFGLSLVLANQSLRQIDGRGSRPNVGEAALANAANLIALRVGALDAASLAPWFEREAASLCHQPDFHATARVLQNGRPLTAPLVRLMPA
jgi:hypothetical protein